MAAQYPSCLEKLHAVRPPLDGPRVAKTSVIVAAQRGSKGAQENRFLLSYVNSLSSSCCKCVVDGPIRIFDRQFVTTTNDRLAPEGDIRHPLFNHLVGTGENCGRHFDPK
jgi:hypothetical protein